MIERIDALEIKDDLFLQIIKQKLILKDKEKILFYLSSIQNRLIKNKAQEFIDNPNLLILDHHPFIPQNNSKNIIDNIYKKAKI
jgi:hypothetical protein